METDNELSIDKYPRIHSKADLIEWMRYEDDIYTQNRGGIRYKVLYMLQASERVVLHKHMKLLRKAEYHTNCNHRFRAALSLFKLHKFQNKYSLHIPINTCGKGLHLMHLGSVLMNEKTRLGEDCAVHINTAFVAGSKIEGAPRLGNKIVVFTGASVIGGIQIADGIYIGANAVVNKVFLEENIVIAGVPAKKIKTRD